MIVTVCDGCGVSYKPYLSTSNGAGNAMTIVTRSKQKKIEPVVKLDLCPKCMDKVWDFVRDELVTENSLRYHEFFDDEEVGDTTDEPTPNPNLDETPV